MAHDPDLADRMRETLSRIAEYEEFKMFGGVAFKVNTHMIGGVSKGELHLRLGPEAAAEALAEDGFSPMDLTGRIMKGWATAEEPVWSDPDRLVHWLGRAADFARALPPKTT